MTPSIPYRRFAPEVLAVAGPEPARRRAGLVVGLVSAAVATLAALAVMRLN